MALLPILHLPDPRLRRKARKVQTIDVSVQRLIDDMVDTMHDAHGVGLAATQVGVPQRVCVIEPPEGELLVLINPQIIERQGARKIPEGCLSLPGYQANVKRAEVVKAKALDREGKEVRVKADGLVAQALEHEVDHLDGIMYVDRLESLDELYEIKPEEGEQPEEAIEAGRGSNA
ncbi:MAG: peptide deformylase [Chloroflexi bacterium]|nr:peptide deformylase [Chloroflexota bacterium]